MPSRKIKGGSAARVRVARVVSGEDSAANVVPAGATPQAMPNAITVLRGGGRCPRTGKRICRCGTRKKRRGRRSTRKGGRKTYRRGGGMLATAALPFGLLGLQKLFQKSLVRKWTRKVKKTLNL